MHLYVSVKGIQGRRAERVRGHVADRAVVVFTEVIANPNILCMFECPHKGARHE